MLNSGDIDLGCLWAIWSCCCQPHGLVCVLDGQGIRWLGSSWDWSPNPYLDQSSADVGFLEQEGVIRAVVEPFNAVSGRFEDSWVIGLDCFGKSWLYT